MAMPHRDRIEELSWERKQLSKADLDIEEGWGRLRDQQDLVCQLQSGGRDTKQAERLEQLMKRTLVEWERHRRLIEQRVAYLEKEVLGT
jgi:hypothetical protein